MDNKFKIFFIKTKILTSEECDILDEYVSLDNGYDNSNNSFFINVKINKIMPIALYEKLLDIKLRNNNNFEFNLSGFSLMYSNKELNDYFSFIVNKISSYDNQLTNLFCTTNNNLNNKNQIDIYYYGNHEFTFLKNNQEKMLSYFKLAGFPITKINLLLNKNRQSVDLYKATTSSNIQKTIESNTTSSRDTNLFNKLNSINNSNVVSISDLEDGMTNTTIEGYIFKIQSSKTKTNNLIFNIWVSDNEQAIRLTSFIGNNKNQQSWKKNSLTEKYLNNLKINDWIKAECNFKISQFHNNELCGTILKIKTIEVPKKFNRTDSCPIKRIELLTHSNMSSFDGLSSINSIVEQSKKFNWNAISIVDRNNVHAYPGAYHESKKLNQKIIYGVELNALNRHSIVLNPTNSSLVNSEMVIFDIETTGLINEFDELIEFGAIKLKNQCIIEKINFFIKPSKPISDAISQKTHISNEILQKEGVPIKEALNRIKTFFANCILIAHNGINFDYRFINKKLEQNKMALLTNTIIDTMQVSRLINEEMTQHNLGAIARKYKFTYNELIAHRADFDTEILLKIWQKMLEILKNKNITTINDLYKQTSDNYYTRQFANNYLIIYPKINSAFPTLYKIVSDANTKFLYGSPRTFYDEIDKYRDQFIVANHPIESSLFDSAMNDTVSELEEKIKYFDYVFISPPDNLLHEINRKNITLDQIQTIIKKIINASNKLNKKVIAVSDCYYLNPWDSIGREVFINSKLLNGKRHRLYSFSQPNNVIPKNHLRTTEEMLKEFGFLNDKKVIDDVVINNSILFSNNIPNNLIPIKTKLHTPKLANADNNVQNICMAKLKEYYGDNIHKELQKRLDKELKSILSNGFANIYWIASLLVKQSVSDGYLVGSRGSVGSSFVAYLMGITEVNPLPPHYLCPKCKHFEFSNDAANGYDLPIKKCIHCGEILKSDGHNIPFEVFLGFHGDKVPDIDLNFSGEYQLKAHNFIRKMFGNDHTLRAGTISTIAAKTAFGYVKTFYEQKNNDKIINSAKLDWVASKCTNVKRTTGQHPGGIIIFPKETNIFDFTPYNYPADDKKQFFSSHFDFNSLHDQLLKFDILGHDDPTKLRILHKLTNVDPLTVPLNEKNVLKMFSDVSVLNISPKDIGGEITGVIGLPEFGTTFVRNILKIALPKSVNDLIAISGLSHGTGVWLNNAASLIKNNSLTLSDVVSCRDGIMTKLISNGVDTQVAFNTMESVRKGKGIQKNELDIIKQHNIPDWYIDSCLKIKYLFPKAHATAYVIMALRVAWYKLHYPLEFYVTYFTIKSDLFDLRTALLGKDEVEKKIANIKQRSNDNVLKQSIKKKEEDMLTVYEVMLEMFARGLSFKNIDITKAHNTNFLIDEGKIMPPFICVNGLGEIAARNIYNSRMEKHFTSKEDLMKRGGFSTTVLKELDELKITTNLKESDQLSLFDI